MEQGTFNSGVVMNQLTQLMNDIRDLEATIAIRVCIEYRGEINWGKGFFIINSIFLSEPHCHHTTL